MFKTPRKAWKGGGRSTPGSSSQKPSEGLFENGQWFCECEPRLPAIHLQVKKKGRNNGRWFYTCQRDRKEQCGFFAFEDVAQEREKNYLFNGGREKEKNAIQTHIGSSSPPLPGSLRSIFPSEQPDVCGGSYSLPSISTGDEMDFMSCADEESQKRWSEKREVDKVDERRPAVLESGQSAKRKRSMFVGESDDGEDFGGGVKSELNSDDEREMVALAESATQSQMSQRREPQQTGQVTTPSAQRIHDVLYGLATPHTSTTVGRNSLLLATEQRDREAKRQKMDASATPSRSLSSNGRQRSEPSASAAGVDDYPITEEIMALLGGVPMLDEDVINCVRRNLNSYVLRMRGVERGRDMVRAALQKKDARIAELQGRVGQLEKERSVDRERIKTLATMIKDMT